MRAEHPEPEIRTADLTGFVLTLARWGTPRGDGLALLDPMPDAALESALTTLRELALLDDADRTTVLGGQVADLPLDHASGGRCSRVPTWWVSRARRTSSPPSRRTSA